MHDDSRTPLPQQTFDRRIGYIEILQVRCLRHVCAGTRGQVVDDKHVVPELDEAVGDVRADKAGTAGYYGSRLRCGEHDGLTPVIAKDRKEHLNQPAVPVCLTRRGADSLYSPP